MFESFPSVMTSSGKRGRYETFGGVTDAIDADSTMADGCGTPPLSFAGTYATNTVLAACALSSVTAASAAVATLLAASLMVRRGIVRRVAHASSTLSALPQTMWLSCPCQLPPGVAPTLSITRTCKPQFVPYLR